MTYNHRLQFLEPTKSTADSGKVKRTHAAAFRRRANVVKSGGLADVDKQKKPKGTVTITLPYDSQLANIKPGKWQVEWQDTSEIFGVTSVETDHNGKRPVTTIIGTLNT